MDQKLEVILLNGNVPKIDNDVVSPAKFIKMIAEMYSGEIEITVLDRKGKSSYNESQHTSLDIHCFYGIIYNGKEIGRIKFSSRFPTDGRLIKEAVTQAVENFNGKNYVKINTYKEETTIKTSDCWDAKNVGYFLTNGKQ